MKKFLLVACGLVLIAGVSGCGSSADSLWKDQIKLMNELADALESGAAQSKIDDIGKKIKDNDEKLKALKLSDTDRRKLLVKYKDDMAKASKRVLAAVIKDHGEHMGNAQLPDFGGLGEAPQSEAGGQGESKK
jgi:hypothetical protein